MNIPSIEVVHTFGGHLLARVLALLEKNGVYFPSAEIHINYIGVLIETLRQTLLTNFPISLPEAVVQKKYL